MNYEYENINNQLTNMNNTNSAQDNRKANILCGISLACVIGAIILFFAFGMLESNVGSAENELLDIVSSFVGALEGLMMIAGFVLMIYVRVRYPKNIFGKVLMWSYIVFTIIVLIIFIAAVVFLYLMCNAVMEGLQGCQSMG